MIRRVTQKKLGKNKTGWIFDKRSESWSTYELDVWIHGERVRRRGFRTRKDAEELETRLKAESRLSEFGLKPVTKFPLVADLFEARLAELAPGPEIARSRRVFGSFLEILGPGARIDQVAKTHYREFAERRSREGVKPGTANREITVIAATINRAGDYFPGLERFIAAPVFRPKFSKRSRGKVISSDDRDRLLDRLLAEPTEGENPRSIHARLRAGLIIKFALLSGLRHGEICMLRKTWLDRRRRVLKVERPKVDQAGEIALSSGAIDVLDRAATELYPDGPFFFSHDGKYFKGIYRFLKKVSSEIGIPYGRNTADGFVVHDARHTFITTLQASGFDLATISSFSGHSDAHMVHRYTHATEKSRREAAEQIDREMADSLPEFAEIELLTRLYNDIREGKLELEDFVAEMDNIFK
jgi:integrase